MGKEIGQEVAVFEVVWNASVVPPAYYFETDAQ
jgi:hypothetical protein